MPTIIGINQVPANIPRPTIGGDYGYAGGALLRALLLAQTGQGGAFGPGNLRTIPNPTYGQQNGLPQLNPNVQLQSAPLQGNPLAPAPNPQTVIRSFTTPAPPPIFPNRPYLSVNDIETAQTLAAIRKAQAESANAPLEQAYKQSQINATNAQGRLFDRYVSPATSPTPTVPASAGGHLAQLQAIADKADAGDPAAQAVMDYILSH